MEGLSTGLINRIMVLVVFKRLQLALRVTHAPNDRLVNVNEQVEH